MVDFMCMRTIRPTHASSTGVGHEIRVENHADYIPYCQNALMSRHPARERRTEFKSIPVAVIMLMALEAVLAFLGFASGITYLADPSGRAHGMDTTLLATTPIRDFTPVGLFFVTCYGILPVLAAFGLWRHPRWRWTDPFNKWTGQNWAWTGTVATGVILIVWIALEVMLIGSPEGFPRFLQVMMALMGIVILALVMLPRVRAFTKLVD
jgi:hypothetical protein